jgi:transcriptional regulator with XRE-family HTH domain
MLARTAQLDRGHLNLIKNGRVLPTVGTALAIARALDVPVTVAFPPASAAHRRPRGAHSRLSAPHPAGSTPPR